MELSDRVLVNVGDVRFDEIGTDCKEQKEAEYRDDDERPAPVPLCNQ